MTVLSLAIAPLTRPGPGSRLRRPATGGSPLRRAFVSVAVAIVAGTVLAGCGPDRGDPFIDFDTRTNVITIDAPIHKKHRSEVEGHRGEFRYVFSFKITKGNDTHTSAVWVSPDAYGTYDKGDWLRLRCEPAADFCDVIAE